MQNNIRVYDVYDIDDIIKEQTDSVKAEDKEQYQKIFSVINRLAEEYFSSGNKRYMDESLKEEIEKILYNNCTLIMRVAKINGGFQLLNEEQGQEIFYKVIQSVFKKKDFNPYKINFSDYIANKNNEEIKNYLEEDIYDKNSTIINELSKEYFSPEEENYLDEKLKLRIMELLFKCRKGMIDRVKTGKNFPSSYYSQIEDTWRDDIYIDTLVYIFAHKTFDPARGIFMKHFHAKLTGNIINYLRDRGPQELRNYVNILENNTYVLKDANENADKDDPQPLKVYSNKATGAKKDYQIVDKKYNSEEKRMWYKIRYDRTIKGEKAYHSGWISSDKVNLIKFTSVGIERTANDEDEEVIDFVQVLSNGEEVDSDIELIETIGETLLNFSALVNNFNAKRKINELEQLYYKLFYTEQLIQLLHVQDNINSDFDTHERDILTATEKEWLDYLLYKQGCSRLKDIMVTRAKYYEELRMVVSQVWKLPVYAVEFFDEKEETLKRKKAKGTDSVAQHELSIPIKPREFIIYEMFFGINNYSYKKEDVEKYRRKYQNLRERVKKSL